MKALIFHRGHSFFKKNRFSFHIKSVARFNYIVIFSVAIWSLEAKRLHSIFTHLCEHIFLINIHQQGSLDEFQQLS